MSDTPEMLVDGFAHVAVLTSDTDRFCTFYGSMFGAVVDHEFTPGPGMRLTMLRVGPTSEFNIFEIEGNPEAARQTPMFGRGRLDHLALNAPSLEAFDTIRDRLVAAGASDGFVTDFGPVLSLFFTDPDGLEAEVIVENPDAQPGVLNPPGTPAARYAS
jgi:catechol 2,3-dioxygenase-like lactoylglutathione lyase family enzyme